MRTEQLSYFIEVAQNKSIRSAADNLFISQQSLNASIQKLEEEMGAVFFKRTSQGVSLTTQGEEMLALAHSILNQILELKFKFQLEKSLALFTKPLSILVSPMTYSYFIPEIITTFSKLFPESQIVLQEKTNNAIFDTLSKVDHNSAIGFINVTTANNEIPNNLSFIPLCEVKYIAISTKNSIKKLSHDFTIDKLLKQSIVLYEIEEHNSQPYKLLSALGDFSLALSTNSKESLINYLRSNDAICILPEMYLATDPYGTTFLSKFYLPEEYFHSTLGLLVNKNYKSTEYTQAIDTLIDISIHYFNHLR